MLPYLWFVVTGKTGYRPLSRCGHLDFTPFQLIVTKLRLDEIIVWCLAQWMLAFITVLGNREHDRDGESVIKVLSVLFVILMMVESMLNVFGVFLSISSLFIFAFIGTFAGGCVMKTKNNNKNKLEFFSFCHLQTQVFVSDVIKL